LVDMMVVVHDEVRGLFEEIEAGAEPIERLWTILDLTETHFRRCEPTTDRFLFCDNASFH